MNELTHVQKLSIPQRLQMAVVFAPIFARRYDFSDPKNAYEAIANQAFELAAHFTSKAEAMHAEAKAKDDEIADKLAKEVEKQRLKDEAVAREVKQAEDNAKKFAEETK